MINKMYLIPAVISLGAHALFLLSPENATRPTNTHRPPVVEKGPIFILPEDKPEPVALDHSYEEAPAPKGNPLPGLEELLSTQVSSTAFVMDVPYTGPVDGPITNLAGVIGRPDGIGYTFTGGTGPKLDAIDMSKLDNHPRARYQAPVDYPHTARASGAEGSVLLEFLVDEKGNVLSPRVIDSSDALFNEAALQSIRHWRFEPGRLHGKTVSFKMRLPMSFTISHSEI